MYKIQDLFWLNQSVVGCVVICTCLLVYGREASSSEPEVGVCVSKVDRVKLSLVQV